jgi:predicted nucleic acid-binding protein
MNALFDSNILIDYLNGIPEAKLEMDLYDRKSISIVTWIEVMAGTDALDEVPTRVALAEFNLIPLSSTVAELAFTLRRDSRMKLPDAMIFATAQSTGLLFVTRNTRDFDSTDPQVRVPYII